MNTCRLSNRLKHAKLVKDRVEDFVTVNRQLFSAEVLTIKQTGMRTDGDLSFARSFNHSAHRTGVAGMKTTSDVGRGDEGQKFLIMTRAFAEVCVEIDYHLHLKCASKPRRNCSRWRARWSNCACASLSDTSAKRTRSPGQSCAAIERSTPATCAIFG